MWLWLVFAILLYSSRNVLYRTVRYHTVPYIKKISNRKLWSFFIRMKKLVYFDSTYVFTSGMEHGWEILHCSRPLDDNCWTKGTVPYRWHTVPVLYRTVPYLTKKYTAVRSTFKILAIMSWSIQTVPKWYIRNYFINHLLVLLHQKIMTTVSIIYFWYGTGTVRYRTVWYLLQFFCIICRIDLCTYVCFYMYVPTYVRVCEFVCIFVWSYGDTYIRR